MAGWKRIWPGKVMPEVYYDPRSLDREGEVMSCLNAKAVMIDESKVLITSANFSEAVQVRNIEAGVLTEDEVVTKTYRRNFQRLVEDKLVRSLWEDR
ncbi:MAG: phospholipase D-like domain-containing protein [Acidobacteriota bacterium]|nr:phospholipase D-like domain-containing protein [Acidobacteriota bacterium]